MHQVDDHLRCPRGRYPGQQHVGEPPRPRLAHVADDRNQQQPFAQLQDRSGDQLDQADYIILSSNRLYGSIPRLPTRYPMTVRYYKALFDGSLGFKKVADIHSYPSLFGLEIPDLNYPVFRELSVSRMLGQIDALLHGDPAVLFGSSLGGYTAALWSALRPGRTRALVLLARMINQRRVFLDGRLQSADGHQFGKIVFRHVALARFGARTRSLVNIGSRMF